MKSATLKLSSHTLRVSLEMITPKIAERYLGKNKHNRNLRAIVEAGTAVMSVVVRGVAPVRAQQTIDAGAKRTFAQQLRLLGEPNAQMLAAAIASIYRLTVLKQESSNDYPTIFEGLKILDRSPGIRDSLQWGETANRCEVRFAAGQAAGLNFLFRTVDHDDADLFFERLCEGTELGSDDPIFLLRRLLIRARQGSRTRQSGRTLSVTYRGAITIKAWLRWRAGDKVKNLRWQGGGANPEPFPQFDDEVA